MPVNKQTTPAQPAQARYPVMDLFLMPRLTRATYQEKFGEQAPAFDPARRIQRWFFTDVLEGSEDPANELVQFSVWDEQLKKVRPYTCSKLQASTPNLPGKIVYPKWVNPEMTTATLVGPRPEGGEGSNPLNGALLVDSTLAKSVMDEINAALRMDFQLEYPPDPWPWHIVWGSETRRNVNFRSASDPNNVVGAIWFVKNRFAAGVGAPGNWVKTDLGSASFVPDVFPDGETDVRPEIPMPMRQLFPNERIDCTPFGCIMVRTDLTQNDPGPGTGALTSAQDSLLKQIATNVGLIKEKVQA